jgi:hypothetical protein
MITNTLIFDNGVAGVRRRLAKSNSKEGTPEGTYIHAVLGSNVTDAMAQ